MSHKHLIAVLVLLIGTACSVKVTPITSVTGTVDPETQSITEIRNNIAFTAKLDELSVAPYQVVDNIVAFHITIDNRTDHQAVFPLESFLLKNSDGYQYRAIRPERVREIVSKDTVYLIPYPYVGYYYLDDQALVTRLDRKSTTHPFYAEYHPQEIFTRALPDEPVLGSSKISGVVYFVADIENTDRVNLLLFPSAEMSNDPLVEFSFRVEK